MRIVQRTCRAHEAGSNEDVRKLGGIDLPTIQKYINLWYSLSADLFGGEISIECRELFRSEHQRTRQEDSYRRIIR